MRSITFESGYTAASAKNGVTYSATIEYYNGVTQVCDVGTKYELGTTDETSTFSIKEVTSSRSSFAVNIKDSSDNSLYSCSYSTGSLPDPIPSYTSKGDDILKIYTSMNMPTPLPT